MTDNNSLDLDYLTVMLMLLLGGIIRSLHNIEKLLEKRYGEIKDQPKEIKN